MMNFTVLDLVHPGNMKRIVGSAMTTIQIDLLLSISQVTIIFMLKDAVDNINIALAIYFI